MAILKIGGAKRLTGALLVLVTTTSIAFASTADVEKVSVSKQDGTYRFDVTVRHGDTGWDHYANRWDVVAPDGEVLGERVLAHPHETEQPFTRSLTGVEIPEGITEVTIRANDSVHGLGGKEMKVQLPE